MREWLPDSNSRISMVACYFLHAWLGSLGDRLRDPAVVEALVKMVAENYNEMDTPKEQRVSWAHQLFCRLSGTEPSDAVPTRYKPRFVELYKQRAVQLRRDIKQLPFCILPGTKKIQLDFEVGGIYTKAALDKDGRYHEVHHCDGHKASH